MVQNRIGLHAPISLRYARTLGGGCHAAARVGRYRAGNCGSGGSKQRDPLLCHEVALSGQWTVDSGQWTVDGLGEVLVVVPLF